MKKAFWHNPIKSKTMKKQILFALLLLASISLSAQEGFKIAGRLGGTLGGKLLLVTIGSEGAVKLDETTMTNGSFDFAGKVDAVTPAYILTEERQPIASLMLENTEFAVVAGQEGIEVEGGGDAQKIWNQYETISQLVSKEKMKMEQEAQTAYSSGNQMKLQAVQQQYLKVAEEAGRQQAALFEAYKDSPVTAFMIFTVMQQADYAYLKELYDGLGETAKNCISGQLIAQRIEQFKNRTVQAGRSRLRAFRLHWADRRGRHAFALWRGSEVEARRLLGIVVRPLPGGDAQREKSLQEISRARVGGHRRVH